MKNRESRKIRRSLEKLILAFVLIASQLFAGRIDAHAAGGQSTLNITNLSMSVGQTQRLRVSNADEITWSSSRPSVAAVSSGGLIRAKKAGRTTVTATVGGRKLKCYVVVNDPSGEKKNVLIAFFSQTETTAKIARKIHRQTGGDLMVITPKNKYTDNYDRLVQTAERELRDNARPGITTAAKNIDSYDVIYIGYPIWWGNAPRVVNTFLEQYDLSGKTVIPFCTSGGSSIEDSLPDLEQSCEGAEYKKGYTADEGSEEEVREWLIRIGEVEAEKEEDGGSKENSGSSSAGDEESNSKDAETGEAPLPEQAVQEGKLLVAYFSWSGTSERIAQSIIAQTGADSFRIERETPYSTDYTETAYGDAKAEADSNARPPIREPLASVAEYEGIIICYPIWWHTAPMTVGTFLESYDLTGKTIYPVSQSASMDRSQYAQSVEFIKECAGGAAVDDGIFTRDAAAIEDYVERIRNGR